MRISQGADLVGISLMTNFFDNAVQITQRLKKDLDTPVIWGGIHPTIRPMECLDYADMVCVGEGEETVVELAKKIEKGRNYQNVQGLWLKNKNEVIKNNIRPLIQNLDSIPFPDYDCKNHYILDDKCLRKMDENLLQRYTEGTYMTIPTRGCPFGCAYCCNNTLNKMYPRQKPIRERSADNVIRELMQVKTKLPKTVNIKFDDDAFFIKNVEEISKFCKKYKENINLPLIITGANPSTLAREKMALLVDAGLRVIRMGIQTGSKRMKKLYGRYYTNQQVKRAVEIINEFKNKIERPVYDIILENPWETDEDLTETLMFLCEFPAPYVLQFFSLTFYPETELYRKAKAEGLITDDLKDVYRKYYHSCKKTYLNSLVFLLNEYAIGGGRIPSKIMFLLTNQKYRKLKISLLFYYLLKLLVIPYKVRWLFYLFRKEALKDLRKGDWHRIIRYLKLKWNLERAYRNSLEATTKPQERRRFYAR